MSATSTQGHQARREPRLAWIVLATPVAWFVHEIAAVALVGRSCNATRPAELWPLGVLAVAAGAIALGGALAARAVFKKAAAGDIGTAESRNRTEFIAQLGFFLNLLLLLNIVLFALVPLLAGPCA